MSRNASMIVAATAYVALTFVAGFFLGILREFVIRPQAGELGALLIEAPMMLAVMFFAARWVVTRFMPEADMTGLLIMGFIAFAWLMTLEIGGNLLLRGLTPAQWYAQLQTVPGMISLALFAAFPVMPVLARPRSST
jgi:hypothetical protein